MFVNTIKSLISNEEGYILPSFAATTPEQWAEQQMMARYNQVINAKDAEGSFPRLCYEKLKEEREALSTWFDDKGKLSPTLQTIFMTNRLSGPIDDGLGWDFTPDGSPEYRMLVFKGTLLAVWRSAHLMPLKDRHGGSMQFGGLATLSKSAYAERARLHNWRGYRPDNDNRSFNGEEMGLRWAAYRSFLFLLSLGTNPRWAWEASGAFKCFGPVDERKVFI